MHTTDLTTPRAAQVRAVRWSVVPVEDVSDLGPGPHERYVVGYDVCSDDGDLDDHFDDERDAQRRADWLNEHTEVPA